MRPERFDHPPFRGEIDADLRAPELESALARLPELIRDPKAEVLLKSRNMVVALDLPAWPGRSFPAAAS